VFLGDQDITSQFTPKARLAMREGQPGLKPLYYEVQLSQNSLVVDYSYHEKMLSCQASLAADDVPPTLNSSLVNKDAVLNITLLCESLSCYFILSGYWTTCGYANSRTGQLVDWTTRGLGPRLVQSASWRIRELSSHLSRPCSC